MNLVHQKHSRLLQAFSTLSARLEYVYEKITGSRDADQSKVQGTGIGNKAAQSTTRYREARKVSIRSRFSAPNSGFGAATTVVPFKRVESESSGMQKTESGSCGS
jgi:hypothetical protein